MQAESQVSENTLQINLLKGLTTYTYGVIVSSDMQKVTVSVLKCSRCRHSWIARRPKAPKVCPKCKRTDWASSAKTLANAV